MKGLGVSEDGGPVTGSQLYAELVAAARAARVTPQKFVEPITSGPHRFVEQLKIARRPKAGTVERVRALIAGRDVPPAARHCASAHLAMTRAEAEAAGIPPSGRSRREAELLAAQNARRDALARAKALSDLARETRRPGQAVADRLAELKRAARSEGATA